MRPFVSRNARVRRLLALAALVAALAAGAARAEVRWSNGEVTVPQPMSRPQLTDVLGRLAARPDQHHVVLYFSGPLREDQRTSLGARGAHLLSYLGDNAWFAALDRGLDAARLAATPALVRVDAVATSSKLHPDLAAGVVHPWSVVGEPPKSE